MAEDGLTLTIAADESRLQAAFQRIFTHLAQTGALSGRARVITIGPWHCKTETPKRSAMHSAYRAKTRRRRR